MVCYGRLRRRLVGFVVCKLIVSLLGKLLGGNRSCARSWLAKQESYRLRKRLSLR